MSASFLDLPIELRDEIYSLIIPTKRGASDETFSIETDTKYWEDHPILSIFRTAYGEPLPTMSEEVLRLGVRLLRTCRQVNEEAAPYIYSQQRYRFYRPQQALHWLDRIGRYQIHLRHVAILGTFVPLKASEEEQQVQTRIWAAVLRKLPNITSLSCLVNHQFVTLPDPDWSNTIWSREVVLKAIRSLAHVRLMMIGEARRAVGGCFYSSESSLEPAFDKPLLETLVLKGHPIAGVKWYLEDYFDRLSALKHLTFHSGKRMQSGKSKVSNDFFTHIAPLRSFTWYGPYLTSSHGKAFTTRHGDTLQLLELNILDSGPDLIKTACLDSHTKMLGALPVLKALKLTYYPWWFDCARVLEKFPRSLIVLSINAGAKATRDPGTVKDGSLDHALRKLPERCPQLAHVRLFMDQRVVAKDQLSRCGTLSIDTHAALDYLSSRIKDTFIPGCVARGCNSTAPMDPVLTLKILQCWKRYQPLPISELDLSHPWECYYAGLESVISSKYSQDNDAQFI